MTDRSETSTVQPESDVTAGGGNRTLPSETRFLAKAEAQLDEALAADEPSVKNYHIRSALQSLVIVDENGSR